MNITEEVNQLKTTTFGIKSEILDIKEYLADKEDKIRKCEMKVEESIITTELSIKKMQDELSEMLVSSNPDIDLSNYVTRDYLFSNYSTTGDIKSYVTESISNFVKKSELFNLIPIKDYITSSEVESNYVKKGEISLDKYVTNESHNRDLNNLSSTIYRYVPEAILKFKNDNNLATESYVSTNYVSKKDIEKYLDGAMSDIDFNGYAKLSDLNKYLLRSEFGKYVDVDKYTSDMLGINSLIKTINNTFGNYVTKSQLGEYVKPGDIFDIIDDDYVTKEYLLDELKKLSLNGNSNPDIDTSGFLTDKDYFELKKFVADSLIPYVRREDVFSRETIKNKYIEKDDVKENYYTKNESNSRFLLKNDAAGTYLTLVDAYAEFLSKEDYRGIKDAMTLNSAYKHDKDGRIFDFLLGTGGILDGFYIIGDSIVIVKDGKKYSTNLTGSNSYTRDEIDSMFEEKSNQFREKNWRMDTGGNY